jgi:hypothetical protein
LKFKDFSNFFDDCGNQAIPRLLDVALINADRLFEINPNPNAGEYVHFIFFEKRRTR